jgi:lipopolysaccharide/colanic/teichoic acid biosynthesis glycosyltransferase
MLAEVAQDQKASRWTNGKGLPRFFDVLVAAAALVLAMPVIGLAALGIVATSGWPVFFRQKRAGKHGQTFQLYKLRTMKPSKDGPQITNNSDTRITTLGRFLRHSKLDELPTFRNVLRGDMALVGPRPEVPRFVNLEDPIWKRVLAVRPGLTDPVTVHLRNEAELLAGIEGDPEQYYVKGTSARELAGYVAYLEQRNCRGSPILGNHIAAIIRPGFAPIAAGAVDDRARGRRIDEPASRA